MRELCFFLLGGVAGIFMAMAMMALLQRIMISYPADLELPEEAPVNAVLEVQKPEAKIPGTNDYAVAGRARTIPWHIRKRELEAAARTKRKQIEEFREEA